LIHSLGQQSAEGYTNYSFKMLNGVFAMEKNKLAC